MYRHSLSNSKWQCLAVIIALAAAAWYVSAGEARAQGRPSIDNLPIVDYRSNIPSTTVAIPDTLKVNGTLRGNSLVSLTGFVTGPTGKKEQLFYQNGCHGKQVFDFEWIFYSADYYSNKPGAYGITLVVEDSDKRMSTREFTLTVLPRGTVPETPPLGTNPPSAYPPGSGTGITQPGTDILGRVWNVTEGDPNWKGVWTRRGNSNVFDAVWTGYGRTQRNVLTMLVRGNQVFITRGSGDDRYSGTIAPDQKSASGSATWYRPGMTWFAIIDGGPNAKLGRVWQVTEGDPNWKGTWTHRGDSSVFDAVWSGYGQTQKDVLTMEVTGNQVTISRGTRGDRYTGVISSDNQTASGTATWYQPGFTWKANIQF